MCMHLHTITHSLKKLDGIEGAVALYLHTFSPHHLVSNAFVCKRFEFYYFIDYSTTTMLKLSSSKFRRLDIKISLFTTRI